MLLITCPVTGTRALVSIAAVRSIVNHPDSIAVSATCPACGQEHVHRTGRRLESARRAAALEVAVRRAEAPTPA
ncbi:hypothetical protein [Candidatus Blastococcus massiliensis]|uniref:hypothetical protein n=1 Tax=Candidatus Blastococcus massiliensis TaxID=1470358 RepID=UPI00058C950E|nr:hypothetical protein [Candidatus Blastococcus massiliensis]